MEVASMIGYWVTVALMLCAIAAVVTALAMEGIGDAPSARGERAQSAIVRDDPDETDEGLPNPSSADASAGLGRDVLPDPTASTRIASNLRP